MATINFANKHSSECYSQPPSPFTIETKEVQNRLGNKSKNNLDLIIFNAIKQGKNPAKIWKELGTYKQKISYHLKSMQAENQIRKVGYGTWEIVKNPEVKEVQKSARIGISKVRCHSFLFTIDIPATITNWKDRRAILTKQGISFMDMNNIIGGAEGLFFKSKKVILTSKSILVYEPASYFAETSSEGKSYAIAGLRKFTEQLCTYLGMNLSSFKFRISRQHYALIKNELAKQYNDKGEKLHIKDENGYWAVIDKSYGEDEFEAIHPKTSELDCTTLQDFFNDLKENPAKISEIIRVQSMMTQNQLMFDKNFQSHLNILWQLGNAVDKLTDTIKKLEEKRTQDSQP